MNDHWIETYKSAINLSIEGFKFCALANGGASVALLAYLGNVAGKTLPMPDMRMPMAAFLVGLTACGLSMLLGYLTQLRLLGEIGRESATKLSHSWLLRAAILCFACSILAFGIGAWGAVIRFR